MEKLNYGDVNYGDVLNMVGLRHCEYCEKFISPPHFCVEQLLSEFKGVCNNENQNDILHKNDQIELCPNGNDIDDDSSFDSFHGILPGILPNDILESTQEYSTSMTETSETIIQPPNHVGTNYERNHVDENNNNDNQENGDAQSNKATVQTDTSSRRKKPYMCLICQKLFSTSGHLITHMRTHTQERPYSCNLCTKRFNTGSDMKRHRRTHTGEQPYLCPTCGKRFNQNSNLIQHVRIHTGQRPFKCQYCPRAFTASSNLINHEKIHHYNNLQNLSL